MKKLLTILAILAIFQGRSFGQDTVYIIKEIIRETVKEKRVKERPGKDIIPEKRNELTFGAGWVPYFNYYSDEDKSYFGSYNIGYNRYINERYTTGFRVSYLRTGDYYYDYNDLSEEPFSPTGRHFISYMGSFNLNYYNKKNITLYMGASLGLMTIIQNNYSYNYDTGERTYYKDRSTVPIADLTAFGIRMQNKTVSPFFEVGLGLSGFFRGGVNFRF